MNDIGIRLKLIRQRCNIHIPAIAAATGIAKETLYKWEKGTKPSNLNNYLRLKDYLDQLERSQEYKAFEVEKQQPVTIKLPLNPDGPPIPQIDGKAASGTILFTNNDPELIVDRISAPFLGKVDGVIEVIGHSMEPTFPNGCRIIITRIRDIQTLNCGSYYYIIDSNFQGIVRKIYLREDKNYLQLVADNPDQNKFPPMERTRLQIEAIFKVNAAIIRF
ncbi:LexA family transcriptional regulator [Longitalea luteola]|uniref:LexA family transcriptional regulator n=1 Tax=Longitalea luteola TaxID=2812563 RepID=UPI001A960695|nr:S24 family peptidase [Longitalea luteola]